MSVIPIDEADIPAARALRVEFARFWSTEQGESRAVYDRFTAATPIAAGTTVQTMTSGDPGPGLWVRPDDAASDAAIMFVHGGGYGLGSVSSYVGLVSQVAARTRVPVFALEYPLAPEAQLPAALDLAVATLGRLTDRHDAVAVVGDSAGGGLSLATAARAVTEGLNVAAVVAFSPWTDLSLSGASVREHAVGDPLLDPAYLRASAAAYLGSASPDDPRASPLFGITSSLPPLLLQVGSDEILLDDSRRFAEAVVNSGGTVELEVWEGMHHVFQLNVEQLVSARRALDRAAVFVTAHLNVFRRGRV
ncbi:alpha/beta hydrolase [Mycobacterium sp. 3519A]|uniref:alpha/beta hydrolase n=1 Tax=Mycobacterium sp. 3519A TaxID=2057184 RepID=UPI000C796709|nr:alpha/beta hydrolase [Mycobacterium sp. 3519A]